MLANVDQKFLQIVFQALQTHAGINCMTTIFPDSNSQRQFSFSFTAICWLKAGLDLTHTGLLAFGVKKKAKV